MPELDNSEIRRLPEELRFGDVFTTLLNTSSKYVITDVGSDSKVDKDGIPHFSASEILNEKPGEEVLALSGGHDIRDIGEIVDTWSLDRILNAYKRSFQGILGDRKIKEVLNYIIGYSKNRTRKII